MTQKVKWLLAGPGDIAHTRVAPALTAAKNSQLTAICGRPGSPKTLDLAQKHSVDLIFENFEEALEKSGADAVYISTPHHLHVEMLKKALAAGKHVFCEKPLGINAGECLEAAQAADIAARSGIKAACSNYRLFTKQFKTTEKLIQAGEIGELAGAWLQDEEAYYNPGRMPLLKKLGANPEHGFGFYLINLAQHLFGKPEAVFCAASSFNGEKREEYDIDDYQNILLRFPGGKQVTILLNFAANAVMLRHSYSFAGTKGRILWPGCPPHFDQPIELVRGWGQVLDDSITGDGKVKPNWHLPMIQDFIDAILEDRTPYCTVRSAAETAVITAAAERSALSGKWELL